MGPSGTSSGGQFASGSFERNDRTLELHFRYGLGLVTYRIGEASLDHESYLRHSGIWSARKYPDFGSTPIESFQALSHDLSVFCTDFLRGNGDEFKAIAAAHAANPNKFKGFSALGKRLTLPSRGRATSGFASCRPPLMSNVRALQAQSKWWSQRSSALRPAVHQRHEHRVALQDAAAAPGSCSQGQMCSAVRPRTSLKLARLVWDRATHPTLRPGSNISGLLALRAAVLRRAVSNGS
jgi:hypothetical protein